MLDIALFQTSKGYDIAVSNGDLTPVDNFKTAIEVSLFSNARADDTEVLTPEYRGGWVANVSSPIEGVDYGSKLWLLRQERLTQGTLNKAVSFARLALQWIIDQGQAEFISVSGAITDNKTIELYITITTLSGLTESHYVDLWKNTLNAD